MIGNLDRAQQERLISVTSLPEYSDVWGQSHLEAPALTCLAFSLGSGSRGARSTSPSSVLTWMVGGALPAQPLGSDTQHPESPTMFQQNQVERLGFSELALEATEHHPGTLCWSKQPESHPEQGEGT